VFGIALLGQHQELLLFWPDFRVGTRFFNPDSLNRFQVFPDERATPDWAMKGIAHEIIHLTVNKTTAVQDPKFSMAALVRHVDMLSSSGSTIQLSTEPLDIGQCLKLLQSRINCIQIICGDVQSVVNLCVQKKDGYLECSKLFDDSSEKVYSTGKS
jgi:hypothetical protein